MATKKVLNFGCLGASKIAPSAIVLPAKITPHVALYAVAARDKKRAQDYAVAHGFRKSFGGDNAYQDMINDPELDVVYNSLPNALHFEWTMKALKAGKHVLLEKPATDTEEEASQIYNLAAEKELVVLEAFHYRFHPAIQRVKAILDSKKLGHVQSISVAVIARYTSAPPGDIRWSYALGGGSTMDPGCYGVSLLRYLAGHEPLSVLDALAIPYSHAPEHSKVDKEVTAKLLFPNGIKATLHSNLAGGPLPGAGAEINCEDGTIKIDNFIVPHLFHTITINRKGKEAREEHVFSFEDEKQSGKHLATYEYQLIAFVDKILGRTPRSWIEPEETMGNMKWIEAIYAKDGFGSRPQSNYKS